ncbi:MAG: TatD family hydrolase [Sphingobacteriaceae bacterium]
MFVDTHIHLYAEEFDADRDQLIQKALKNNVSMFYLPNVDSESIGRMHDLEKAYPQNCFAMMGLHPCSVKENVKDELKLVEEWLKKRKYAAIGEIGIDLYWDKTFANEQTEAFKTQIQWALDYNYGIIIHCRDAFDEVYDCLTSFQKLPKGIFHCFSGNVEQAKKIIELNNFKLGIGGVLTFKNSGLDKVLSEIDIAHLVLETDAPYLAPVPHRGKRNEPAFILEVAKRLAEIKEISMFEVEEVTQRNSQFIFS